MLECYCPACKRLLKIPDKYAGQRGRCNHCGQTIRAPHLELDGAFPEADHDLPAMPVEALDGLIEPPPLPKVTGQMPEADSEADNQMSHRRQKQHILPALGCNICNHYIFSEDELRIVPNEKFKEAVRVGFNPFTAEGLNLSHLLTTGIPEEETYDVWRQTALTDSTDWSLCQGCHDAFEGFSRPKRKRAADTKVTGYGNGG